MNRQTGRGAVLAASLLLVAVLVCIGGGSAVQTIMQQDTPAVLVIDAGHGGFDGGATGAAGTSEQQINLYIAQRVQALAGFFGVQTVMTRADELALDYDPSRTIRENKIADIRAREQIANELAAPVFVSIHLNKFSDAQYHGAQVFYSVNHAGSKALAASLD